MYPDLKNNIIEIHNTDKCSFYGVNHAVYIMNKLYDTYNPHISHIINKDLHYKYWFTGHESRRNMITLLGISICYLCSAVYY